MLLAVAAGAAIGVVMPWVRGVGTVAPAVTGADPVGSAAVTDMSAQGVGGTVGAVLLALACVLVVVALWRGSPRYRPVRAGYVTIVVAAVSAATTLWFVGEDELWAGAFGPGVDLHVDSVRLTGWPWLSMGCFVVAIVVGVVLVPRDRRGTEKNS